MCELGRNQIYIEGLVLSPTLFSVYLDDLLKQLRRLGLGCHMGGVWVGAAGYAGDMILLAPSRSAMKKMLKTSEEFAVEHNLQFSTVPDPAKSNTMCIFMTLSILLHSSSMAVIYHGWYMPHTLAMSFISFVTWKMMLKSREQYLLRML